MTDEMTEEEYNPLVKLIHYPCNICGRKSTVRVITGSCGDMVIFTVCDAHIGHLMHFVKVLQR